MSNAVYKPGTGYTYQEDDARVIDMNSLVASKLEVIAEVMERQRASRAAQMPSEEEGDEFTALDASQMERLFGDGSEMPPEEEDVLEPEVDLDAINEQAEAILEQARQEADQIASEAEEDARAIRQQANEEGYQAGFEEGRAQGMASLDGERAEIAQLRKDIELDYEQKLSQLEPAFVEALSGIYEHIFHVDLSLRKDIVFHLLQDAIRKTESSEGYLIHVSPEDYEDLILRREELIAGLGSSDMVEIIQDIGMASGQCSIETGGGIFDCSLDTQLEALKRELILLSYNNG